MAKALESPAAAPTYLEFFGMNRAPFARVSEPIELFHAEQYSLLYAHLCNATERAGYLLVLSGAEGSGKTTLLNRYIASLDEETSYATFDEKCADPNAFYCGLLRQLGFNDISGNLNELQHIAREFLLHRGRAGDPVLVIIDNAQHVSPSVLEQLRWLADISVQGDNVISLVLSGNAELARIMASPAMSLLKLANRVDFSIRAFSEQETDDYVRHRLRLAGGSESAKLVAETRPLIHRFSGGNPRRINRFCNSLLAAALAQKTRILNEALARKVADEQGFVPHVLPVAGQGRRKSDQPGIPASPELTVEERIFQRESPPQQAAADFAAGVEPTNVDVDTLLAQLSRLTAELDASKTRTENILLDVDARDSDIKALIGKIEQQAKELAQAEGKAQDSEEKRQKLKDKLQQTEQRNIEMLDELQKEKSIAKKAHSELAKVDRRLRRLERRKSELQESVRELKSEQKKSTTQSRRAQKAQDKEISRLERCVAKLEKENESIRTKAEEVDRLEQEMAGKELYLKELQGELDEYVEEVTATQAQLAAEVTSTRGAEAPPDPNAYVGTISEFEVFRNGQPDHVVALNKGLTRLMVGRGDDCEICLKSKFVSRHHALVFLSGDRASIEDLRSYNGTIVNTKKITRCDLNPDDTIAIGDFELRPRRG